MFTGQNWLFFRKWQEIEFHKIQFNVNNSIDVQEKNYVPINKGGSFKRWYGNNEFIMKFDDDHYKMIEENMGHRSPQYYFNSCIEWTKITSGKLSLRYSEGGFVNNDASMAIYSEDMNLLKLGLGITNSRVGQLYVSILNESMNYTASDISRIPIIIQDNEISLKIITKCIEITKVEYDYFEESWNFKKSPLV